MVVAGGIITCHPITLLYMTVKVLMGVADFGGPWIFFSTLALVVVLVNHKERWVAEGKCVIG